MPFLLYSFFVSFNKEKGSVDMKENEPTIDLTEIKEEMQQVYDVITNWINNFENGTLQLQKNQPDPNKKGFHGIFKVLYHKYPD